MPVLHERLQTMYGEDVTFRQILGGWCCMFFEGRQSVEDGGRSGVPLDLQMNTTLLEYMTWCTLNDVKISKIPVKKNPCRIMLRCRRLCATNLSIARHRVLQE
ncbi:hypothetical protein TNCV_1403321 [Trichonephila clavipes]|nr:hypothetical protein TNCV_1403321 [Trichonephila clavipes]